MIFMIILLLDDIREIGSNIKYAFYHVDSCLKKKQKKLLKRSNKQFDVR